MTSELGAVVPDRPGHVFLELVAVMDRLRSPGGCPWDARQTHASLVEYLVEETYEAVEAIELADRAGMKEELGDLLLQIVFHSRIAQDDPSDPWSIDDVASGIVAKLVSRHPHVFADAAAPSLDESEASWHALKAKEKQRSSLTDGIPARLPALLLAAKVLARTAPFTDDLGPSPRYEAALGATSDLTDESEFGDLLLSLVAIGRDQGWDAEAALRAATRRRVTTVRRMEGHDD